MNIISWPGWLRNILCNLYQYWGAQCQALGETESQWVAAITGIYAAEGVPQFPDQQATDKFLAELDELETCLDSPDDNLTQADELSLRAMITSLRHEIGPE